MHTWALVCMVSASAPDYITPEVKTALSVLDTDPSIREVQRAALRFFGVTQSEVKGYRSAARLRALVPELSATYTRDDASSTDLSTDQAAFGIPYDPRNPQITTATNGLGKIWQGRVALNLQGLVFDPEQLNAYALVGIHEDVVKEVTRIYYTRQHNVLVLATDPPQNARARAALVIRTRELEAMLDAYTGGAWTEMKARNGVRKD